MQSFGSTTFKSLLPCICNHIVKLQFHALNKITLSEEKCLCNMRMSLEAGHHDTIIKYISSIVRGFQFHFAKIAFHKLHRPKTC